ncbi:MAG: nascent polypeptide-associated complex protein, partial [Methanomicrobiales archaeon HGW-Methanomicrobiales-4]
MIPGMNPRKMKQMMKQLGMDVRPIDDVQEIVITTQAGKYIFDQAEV